MHPRCGWSRVSCHGWMWYLLLLLLWWAGEVRLLRRVLVRVRAEGGRYVRILLLRHRIIICRMTQPRSRAIVRRRGCLLPMEPCLWSSGRSRIVGEGLGLRKLWGLHSSCGCCWSWRARERHGGGRALCAGREIGGDGGLLQLLHHRTHRVSMLGGLLKRRRRVPYVLLVGRQHCLQVTE